ncbi:hypothetical protein H072_3309 [Dactylellina haptotyla CBS 200.50]|uniref:N-acetyltransferase B complex non catalytic subunit n=1 Tax=Dactylellina haptotyla (strain CBS 200.50) TaxID=1284197 RepID=S8AIG5_DACHA|nr:hypothetical protein H072_3309 [Dactylellina haptotyla CBS 200.50]
MGTPVERRNQQVWEALNAPGGGAKQALQLINRRLKKGEKGDHLTAMRAFILAHLPSAGVNPQASPLAEAFALTNELAFRNPPPKESDTIHLLEMTYTYLGKKAEIGKLHEHLYKARIATPGRTKPVDEAGLKEWYNSCMKACDWAGMQKAAMMLQKQFPNNRVYYFWAIAACFIMVVACDDDRRSSVALFGTLASRMISKAASEIPAGKEAVPIRSIRTAAELQLFYEVLSFTKTEDAELVKHLESPTTGFNSRLGSDNYWDLWWLLMEAKLRQREFKDVNDHCHSVLSTGSVPDVPADGTGLDHKKVSTVWKDDWKVWSGYVTSAVEMGINDPDDSQFSRAAALLADKMQLDEPASRNALVATLKFSALCSPHANLTRKEGVVSLLEACVVFFVKQGGKSSCYDDFRPYVEQLTPSERRTLFQNIVEHCKSKDLEDQDLSVKELTGLVREQCSFLKYWFWMDTTEALDDFAGECLNLYKTTLKVDIDLLVTDMPIGDEFLLLVAKSLLCKYAASRMQDPLPVKIAIIVLEHLLTKSKHNYTALLLLVRLYSIIGALTCATVEYQRLSIKQIQNDSLSHHILTRLSTLLPFSISSAGKLLHPTDMADVGLHVPANPTDSLEMYDISLRLYRNANRTNPEMISLAFKNGSYGQIKDMVLFEKRVSTSISACQFEIERRRVQRFRGMAAEGGSSASGALWDRALDITTSDNRTFDLFGEDGWKTGCDMGPRIGAHWVKAFLLAENIMATLVAQSQATAADAPKGLSSSSSSSSKTDGGLAGEKAHVPLAQRLRGILEDQGSDEFTKVERQVLETICLIGDILLESESASKSSAKVKSLLTDITSKLQSIGVDVQPSAKDDAAVGLSQLSLDSSSASPAPWYRLHQSYMQLEVSKYLLLLCDYLEKAPLAKAMKPQISKSLITELRNLIGSSSKVVLQTAKEKAKEAVLVTEADIDAVLGCEGLDMAPVADFLKGTIGREKIEAYMDKIARSTSGTWAAVGGIKIG